MIHSISLENFFSFKELTTIELGSLNVLVGINGSGKSNLLKAIKLLQRGVSESKGFEKLFLQEWGGYLQVANAQTTKECIKLIFEFDAKYLNARGADVQENPRYILEIYRRDTAYFIKETLLWNKHELDEELFGGIKLLHIDFNNVADFDFRNQLQLLVREIEEITVYDYFDTSASSILRKPCQYSISNKLEPDGSNLTQLINRIKNNDIPAYKKIQQLLTKINPHIERLEFDIFNDAIYLVLQEHQLNRTIGAKHISDGTLRFLLYITLLTNPNRGSLICIDEPEMGLHPDMIYTLAECIKTASQTTTVIVATHSPLLLNCFELDELLIFEKDKDNASIVNKKTEDDFKDWEGEFLPGQMWLRGQLGGKRW